MVNKQKVSSGNGLRREKKKPKTNLLDLATMKMLNTQLFINIYLSSKCALSSYSSKE